MYISTKGRYKIIKKEVGKSSLGRPIFREVLEVNCKKGHTFEQDIRLEPDGKLKIECPICLSD